MIFLEFLHYSADTADIEIDTGARVWNGTTANSMLIFTMLKDLLWCF